MSYLAREDAFEPDDTPTRSAFADLSDVQLHNFHTNGDMDWVQFYAVSGLAYSVETYQQGSQVDTMLSLYRVLPDGALVHLDLDTDLGGVGPDDGEVVLLDLTAGGWPEGLYQVCVRSADGAGHGVETYYELVISVPVGGGSLLVVAVDKLNPGHAPPGAVAIVDGVGTQAFNGATSVEFAGLPAGAYTIRVPAVPGYWPEEDPATAGQIANPNSKLYGNPKASAVEDDTWRFAVFQFVPLARADGLIRDRYTGEWLGDAALAFRATRGVISNAVYDRFPAGSLYQSPWVSRADGSFPTNVFLPTVDWDLTVTRAGYSNLALRAAVVAPAPGATTDVGVLRLAPLDTNANGVADAWEGAYYPGGFQSTNDTDRDGADNRSEYLAGTIPTNPASVLRVESDAATNAPGVWLRWPAASGRAYTVESRSSLGAGPWSLCAGPWTIPAGSQAHFTWLATNAAPTRFYRVAITNQ
jgi:hypothetical protein